MENGQLKTKRYGKMGIPRIKNIPKIVVKMVEVEDPLGPYGAKGVGEIGNIPTAGAVANALYQYDKIVRYELPMKKKLGRSRVQGSEVQGSGVQGSEVQGPGFKGSEVR